MILVGVRAFPGAADHDVVSGGWVNHRIFYQILALSLVPGLAQCARTRDVVQRASALAGSGLALVGPGNCREIVRTLDYRTNGWGRAGWEQGPVYCMSKNFQDSSG